MYIACGDGVLALTVPGLNCEQRVVGHVFDLVFTLIAVMNLVILNENVGTFSISAYIPVGIDCFAKHSDDFVVAIFEKLVVLDCDVVHLAPDRQAAPVSQLL